MHNYNITKKDTLIILDWDNTLFPTTWVTNNGIDLRDSNVRNDNISRFTELDSVLYILLNKLSNYGKVVIVTNALQTWVKLSAGVLPKTAFLLNKIKIVSARKNHQMHSSSMMDWKKLAFKNEFSEEINHELPNIITKEILQKRILNIISIGDAEYEYRALIDLYNLTNKPKLLKSIRLMDDPSYETLVDQLQVINKSFNDICLNKKHMDLKFKFI
jgi:hypothetical protein